MQTKPRSLRAGFLIGTDCLFGRYLLQYGSMLPTKIKNMCKAHGLLLLLSGCLCCAGMLFAQVSVLSVTDENKHQTPEDFYHTYEYHIQPADTSLQGAKCQATRITSRWFITAAHCVKPLCNKGCTIQMDVMDTPVSVLAVTTHSKKYPAVFARKEFKDENGKDVAEDFALIKLDVYNAKKIYYRRATDQNSQRQGISEQEFFTWLKTHPKANRRYKKALSPELPPLVDFSVSRNYEIDRKISVVSSFDGVRSIKKATAPVYYIHELGFAYTTNFGIRKGMSGSGVMTNTGELIGVTSLLRDRYEYKIKGKEKQWTRQYHEFIFTVFNAPIIEFMKETMGSDFYKLDRKDAEPSFVKKTNKSFSRITAPQNSKTTQK